MMSRYPTTQELAAFRRSIALGLGRKARYMSHPDGTVAHTFGAWDHELQHGIGYRLGDLGNRIFSAYEPGPAAIREASSLRSRAYWAADCPNGWGLFASYAERVGGIPYWDDPIVSTDTWTEDEPRHPLPIRYQPSFTIG